MTDGIILIDKPTGMTSFGVVARIRRVLSERAGKRVKVGHTGTLDPFATGLMILTIGKECKNAGKYSKLDKVYTATIRLGETSTSGDPEGDITKNEVASAPSRQRVDEVIARFTGEIKQRPPIFSAIKIGGQRAYKLARESREVEIPERLITVYDLEVGEYNYPDLKIRTHVSSGTYIRSLAVDIGQALGTGAYCKELRRLKVADWGVDGAEALSNFGISD